MTWFPPAKERAGLFGATVRGQHEFGYKRKMIGSKPRERRAMYD